MARQFWLEVMTLVVVSLVLGSRGSRKGSDTKLLDDLLQKIADSFAKNDKCKGFSSKLPKGCSITDDCVQITCDKNVAGKDIDLKIKVNRCDQPVTVTIDVKVDKENVAWSDVFTSGDEVAVPGLTYDVANLAEVGLYVKVELADEGGKLNLEVSLEAKAKLGPVNLPSASFKVASEQLPISTEYCGLVRWWIDKNTAVRISVTIAFLLVVLFTITGGCFCGCCCCCKPCKRRSNRVV